MNNITEEIEGSQMGEALAADSKASPYSLTNLRDIICDLRLLVSQYSKFPTVCWDTKEMFVGSLITMLKKTNNQLPFYIEDLKQNKCIEAFCISSGQFRDDDFWTWLDKICNEMRNEKFFPSLKDNADQLQSLLAEAETTVLHCNPIVFEKYFFRKKLDYSDGGVVKRFNLMLYEYHTPSVEKLREMQALAVIEALNKGVFDFAPTPSQQEKDQVSQEFQSGFLPCDFEVTEDFRKAYTKFRRFAEKKDPMMIINYKRYGKYIQNHYYDFSDDQRYAIFELDMMLNLIHKEMVKLEPELAKNLPSIVNGSLENTIFFAPYLGIKKMLQQEWFVTLRSDKKYDKKWAGAFADGLMRSEYGLLITEVWKDKKSQIMGYIIGCLKVAGVINRKISNDEIAREAAIMDKARSFGKYIGKESNEQPYAPWIKDHADDYC